MRKNIIIVLLVLALGAAIWFLIKEKNIPASTSIVPTSTPETTAITFYLPQNEGDRLKYCNGGDMDSVGFANTLTKKVTVEVPGVLNEAEKIDTTIKMAAEAAKMSPNLAEESGYIKITGDVANIVEFGKNGAWAGSSIFMCGWKPFVEKNLSQFTEIKQVIWQP